MSDSENGYFPLTSSVDFCEENYKWSYFVAEPFNVVSSAAIVLYAILGGLHGNVTKEFMFTSQYLALGFTGVGSIMLHLTLSKLWQASDELVRDLFFSLLPLSIYLSLPPVRKSFLAVPHA